MHIVISNFKQIRKEAFAAPRAADDAYLETSRSGKPMPRLETDPWVTESKVVQAHQALHAAQVSFHMSSAFLRYGLHILDRWTLADSRLHMT